MRHKHFEIAKAKIENMHLVLFVKPNDAPTWEMAVNQYPANNTFASYFLCLPQHKEACLHWLNGGEVEYGYFELNNRIVRTLDEYPDAWTPNSQFMSDLVEITYKPRKEAIDKCAKADALKAEAEESNQSE